MGTNENGFQKVCWERGRDEGTEKEFLRVSSCYSRAGDDVDVEEDSRDGGEVLLLPHLCLKGFEMWLWDGLMHVCMMPYSRRCLTD